MARRSTNNSMSAMIASLDENSSARESSPTPISELISKHNSPSVTTGELPQDNPALTQTFSRALEESLPGIFATVRAQVGRNPSSAAPGLVASATDVGHIPQLCSVSQGLIQLQVTLLYHHLYQLIAC